MQWAELQMERLVRAPVMASVPAERPVVTMLCALHQDCFWSI